MPQLDSSTFSAQLWWTLIFLAFFATIALSEIIPFLTTMLKFRKKLIQSIYLSLYYINCLSFEEQKTYLQIIRLFFAYETKNLDLLIPQQKFKFYFLNYTE